MPAIIALYIYKVIFKIHLNNLNIHYTCINLGSSRDNMQNTSKLMGKILNVYWNSFLFINNLE